MILRRERGPVDLRDIELDRVGHLPAAPRLARLGKRLGPLRCGERKGIARAGRIGERGVGIEERQQIGLRRGFVIQRRFGPEAQDIGAREAGVGHHEPGIVGKGVRAAGLQHFPPGNRGVHRTRLARDQIVPTCPLRSERSARRHAHAKAQRRRINP
ncbi:hypothetical protein [Erythrobacter sp. BLCC-B19]|uniref:hypothetical protein n=1 Tax=Erythrobacter sp. BLCC-B19 TaxID=3025315 RepID=UPI00235F780A|nr:hypothetical protein [Erythrobacter sp. BLCC-B19]WDA40358.1 hypothetical protein PS060_12400 [Erythrobacter sp. BLCC-B19]